MISMVYSRRSDKFRPECRAFRCRRPRNVYVSQKSTRRKDVVYEEETYLHALLPGLDGSDISCYAAADDDEIFLL